MSHWRNSDINDNLEFAARERVLQSHIESVIRLHLCILLFCRRFQLLLLLRSPSKRTKWNRNLLPSSFSSLFIVDFFLSSSSSRLRFFHFHFVVHKINAHNIHFVDCFNEAATWEKQRSWKKKRVEKNKKKKKCAQSRSNVSETACDGFALDIACRTKRKELKKKNKCFWASVYCVHFQWIQSLSRNATALVVLMLVRVKLCCDSEANANASVNATRFNFDCMRAPKHVRLCERAFAYFSRHRRFLFGVSAFNECAIAYTNFSTWMAATTATVPATTCIRFGCFIFNSKRFDL